jgi:hypothetical protein
MWQQFSSNRLIGASMPMFNLFKLSLAFLCLLSSSQLFAIDIDVRITRYAFTGEHYLLTASKEELVFQRLFRQGRLSFKSFTANQNPTPQVEDKGARTVIGEETYRLNFENMRDLLNFAHAQLVPNPKREHWGGLERAVWKAIRNYALASQNKKLIRAFVIKRTTHEFKHSKDESLAKLYKPLLKYIENKGLSFDD